MDYLASEGGDIIKYETLTIIVIIFMGALLCLAGVSVYEDHQTRVAIEQSVADIRDMTEYFQQLTISEKIQLESLMVFAKLTGIFPVAERANEDFYQSIIEDREKILWPPRNVGRKLK